MNLFPERFYAESECGKEIHSKLWRHEVESRISRNQVRNMVLFYMSVSAESSQFLFEFPPFLRGSLDP
jgi:hypothetical protein